MAADPDVTIAAGRLAAAAATVAAQLRGAAFEASATSAEMGVRVSHLEHQLHVHRIQHGFANNTPAAAAAAAQQNNNNGRGGGGGAGAQYY